MNKVIKCIIFLFVLLIGGKISAASNPEIQAFINGKLVKGEKIEIIINIKDLKSLYAGDIQLKYDTSFLNIKSLTKGDLLNKAGVQMTSLTNNINAQKGIVRYNFTCLGDTIGYSGTGTFIIITAEVLRDGELNINSKPFTKASDNQYNLWMQLVDSDIKEIDYKFIPNTNSGTSNTVTDAQAEVQQQAVNTPSVVSEAAGNSSDFNNTANNSDSKAKISPETVSPKSVGDVKVQNHTNKNKSTYLIISLALTVLVIVGGLAIYFVRIRGVSTKLKNINKSLDIK